MINLHLKTNLCGCMLKTPFVLASGVWKTTPESLLQAVEGGCSAVTTKSVNTLARQGHKKPIHHDWKLGFINAEGLPGQGADKTAQIIQEFKTKADAIVIASIFGHDTEGFVQACEQILRGNPDIIEVNMSCPNVQRECGTPFACDAKTATHVIAALRPLTDKPLFAKLAPNVPSIATIAQACVAAGADGITVINTVPGMVIDAKKGKPILTNKSGGLSGPAIKPIALKAVYDIRATLPDIPIIGTGGISNGLDSIEMFMAGATVIGVGTAVHYRGIDIFEKLAKEIKLFMQENGYGNLEEIKNLAHRY